MTPLERSRAVLPTDLRRTLEESNLPIEVATAIADLCAEQACRRMMQEALDMTRDAVAAQAEAYVESEALALLRELNDALAIPGYLQPRVDAVLDRAEEKT